MSISIKGNENKQAELEPYLVHISVPVYACAIVIALSVFDVAF